MEASNLQEIKNSTVPDTLIPPNDAERLKALYRYEILDTAPEAFFDKITACATKIFNVASSFISLVDLDRVWYKSNHSDLQVTSVKRKDSLCSITILETEEVTVFYDAHQVPSLLTSPYVMADGGIRFYAGAPLKTHDGYNLGTVCVVDSKPRSITQQEKELLKDLAALVVEELELRAAALKAVKKHDELYTGTLSEVVQPLEQLEEVLDKVAATPQLPASAKALIQEALELSQSIQQNTQTLLLETAQTEAPYLMQPVMTSMAEIARSVVQEFEPVAAKKQQDIYFLVATGREMRIDPHLIRQAFSSLIRFGIVYSPEGSSIALDIFEANHVLYVEFTYEGINLSELDLRKVFLRYTKLSIDAATHETISGEDLSQVKKIIEQHRGMLSARCGDNGKSCKIVIEFPII